MSSPSKILDQDLLPQQNQEAPGALLPDGLYFSNLDAAMSSIPPPTWHCPRNDNSIPTTDTERQQWVLKLLTALTNTDNVNDKPSKAFTKHWLNPTYYTATDKEILCWKILHIVEELHRVGPSALPSFNPRFKDLVYSTHTWTFQERMEKIVQLLTYSKARCEKLLGGASIHRIVANPGDLIAIAKGNAKYNNKRQGFLKAGRADGEAED